MVNNVSLFACRDWRVRRNPLQGLQAQKNRPWAVTTLLHIAFILFVLIGTDNMVPGVGLEPTQP